VRQAREMEAREEEMECKLEKKIRWRDRKRKVK
jgi:hypothetical protein